MPTPIRNMHGAGNDYIVVDARRSALALSAARIAALSDRQTGIGCDQFITLEPSPHADVFMRIHNNTGTEAGACGNATRCVVAILHEETGRETLHIETISGILPALVRPTAIEIDMGVPRLHWSEIPLQHEADTLHLPLEGDPAAVNMGNPHATLFVPDIAHAPVTTQGPALEHHPLFPHQANIGFAQILAPDHIRLRVWERDAGLTRACGTGACAALVNAHRRGLTARRALLELDGGHLTIEWRPDNHVLMTGPATLAFQGTVDLSTYPA
jgi:diaminopimelate epimerase